MADASGAPRRVSMAYILGFSNKPFKDGGPPAPPPPPRHPNAFKNMITTPGGVIEWAASDGRRGKLTGPGKQRLTATNLTQVPSAKVSVKAASKKDAASDAGGMGMCGLFDDAPAATTSGNAAKDDKPDDTPAAISSDWTKEQDEKLLELRAKNPNGPWAPIAEELDKDRNECKARFKEIVPKDWMPNDAKGGKNQKQNKQKDGKNQKGNVKKEEKADEGPKAEEGSKPDGKDNGSGGTGDDNNWGNTDGDVDSGNDNSKDWVADGDKDWGGDNKDGGNTGDGFNLGDDPWATGGGGFGGNGADTWGNTASGGADADNSWDKPNDRKDESGWNTADDWNKNTSNSNNDGAADPAPTAKDSSHKDSKPPSKRSASNSGSKQRSSREPDKPSATAPLEYELRPDSTFSADDLRLVAKILQQDCQMVWNRVSWRFKDKTGRNLHPDVFEKKITGKIEERGSEHAGR